MCFLQWKRGFRGAVFVIWELMNDPIVKGSPFLLGLFKWASFCIIWIRLRPRCEINTQGLNHCSKDVTQTQQQRPELPTVTLTWHASEYRRTYILVGCVYLIFTSMPSKSYRRQLRSLLLHLCDIFQASINSLVCWFFFKFYLIYIFFLLREWHIHA